MPIRLNTVFFCSSDRSAPSARYGLSLSLITTLSSALSSAAAGLSAAAPLSGVPAAAPLSVLAAASEPLFSPPAAVPFSDDVSVDSVPVTSAADA